VTIDKDFGGWQKAQKTHFADGGTSTSSTHPTRSDLNLQEGPAGRFHPPSAQAHDMTILLLAGSPSAPSRSTRLLHHVGDKLAHLGHRYARLDVRDLPGQAILRAD
jgi:hypothetical protein